MGGIEESYQKRKNILKSNIISHQQKSC